MFTLLSYAAPDGLAYKAFQKKPTLQPCFGRAGTFIEKILKHESPEKVIFANRHAAVIPNIDASRPGQVLIVSKRPVDRLKELTTAETSDVFQLTQKYQTFWESLPENKPKTFSYSIFINDGVHAGQSVPHFHVQMVPIESEKPLAEGVLRFAIDPHKKGLPKNKTEWAERIQSVYQLFNRRSLEIQRFATQEGLKSDFAR